MRLIRGRESTTNFQTFPDSSQVSAPLRCQRQNRPILQLPPRQATEAKRLGSLFLRRKVARARTGFAATLAFELQAALVEFASHYSETWLVARHGHRTPAQERARPCYCHFGRAGEKLLCTLEHSDQIYISPRQRPFGIIPWGDALGLPKRHRKRGTVHKSRPSMRHAPPTKR